MPLKVSDGMGAWIHDFKKSDAPQFKGKSEKDRRDMAIAAYMSAKKESVAEGSLEEYGDTARGQKMLTKVHKRAVNRLIKKDDENRKEPDYTKRDLKTVRKHQATADRAWDRMAEEVVAEAQTFEVDVEGLPKMYIKATSPGKIKSKLRSMLKQPSMINDVQRITPADERNVFRAKAQGRDDDPNKNIDEGKMKQLHPDSELPDDVPTGGKKPPFDGPYTKKKVATPGKNGYGPSAAKHLAKQGMKSVKEGSAALRMAKALQKAKDDRERQERLNKPYVDKLLGKKPEEKKQNEAVGYKPGWMLKADPELAKKIRDRIALAKKRQATYGDKNAGKSVKEEVEENYVSNAQRKAVWANRADGGKGHPDNKKKVKENIGKSVKEAVHRVAVTVSEPNHQAVSQRKEKIQRFVRVTADDRESALQKAQKHYKKLGYKVHNVEHHSIIKEENKIDEMKASTLQSYIAKRQSSPTRTKAGADAITHHFSGKKGPSKLDVINTGLKRARQKIDKAREKETGMNPKKPFKPNTNHSGLSFDDPMSSRLD